MVVADLSDAELLRRFAASRDPEAVRALVERYQGIVYASALRQLRRVDRAEDVTQAVFLVLAAKAPLLAGRGSLGGWLMKVTRYAAIDAMRKSNRQARHERSAAQERPETGALPEMAEEWSRLSGVLDAAMARLNEVDRSVIVMRFFEDKPLALIGRAHGVSEEAARKRVARAVQRLREMVQEQGVSMPAVAIGPLLLQNAAPPAPASLSAALAGKASASSFSIAKGTAAMIGWAKAKIIGMVAVLAALGLGGGAIVLRQWNTAAAQQPEAAQPIPTPVNPAALPSGAASLYMSAGDKIVTDSPAASVLDYRLPFGPEWMQMAADAYQRNKPARDLMREARQFRETDWPVGDIKYLNKLRALANDAGDAALYAHSQKRDAEAFELLRDAMHMSGLLYGPQKTQGLIRMLVGIGIDALAMNRLMTINARVALSADGAGQTVAVADARRMIAALLDQPVAEDRLKDAMAGEADWQKLQPAEKQATEPILQASMDRAWVAVQRVSAERMMAAVSLACHVYRFENKRWPARVDDLVPAYLPSLPVDPFGDGKQTFGYVLIKAGPPDGSDRPLVYCRSESQDGLFFRLDEPQYGYYIGDGSRRPTSEQKRGGQFRDLTWWPPRPEGDPDAPTTQPLPQ